MVLSKMLIGLPNGATLLELIAEEIFYLIVSCSQEGSLLTGMSRLWMRATLRAISELYLVDLISLQLMLLECSDWSIQSYGV